MNRIFLICLVLFCFSFSIYGHAGEFRRIRIKTIPVEVEVVTTQKAQQMGLGERLSLPEGQGMLFVYKDVGERVFWMKRMIFPIDIIWINHGVVIHIAEHVLPPAPNTPDRHLKRYGNGFMADMVLEVPAGFVRRYRIMHGDVMVFDPTRS